MKTNAAWTLGAGVLTAGLGIFALAASANADDSKLKGVKNIDVFTNGVPEVIVSNVAVNKQLQNLQLAVQGNTIPVNVGGYVECLGTVSETLLMRDGYFLAGGAFGIGRTSLLMKKNLPNSNSIDNVSDMDAHAFQMPIAMLANPQIDIDPVAIVLAAADQAPNKVGYLRQDHVITVKMPIRWEAQCDYYIRQKGINKKTTTESGETISYLTKDVSLKIKYQGDPQLFAVNAKLSQGGGLPNQVQVGDQPFKITSMSFQPNMPHHVGACPAETTIRVNYMGQGKGEIRIRVNDGGTTIFNSSKIAFDSKNGQQHHDFEIALPKAPKHEPNKTQNHNLRVYVRGKGQEEQVWPGNYQLMDSALWKHRCTPSLNPALGGAQGGKVGGYQNQGQAGPAAAPKRLKAVPVNPRPRRQDSQ